jgi:hypothetical protein
MSQKGTVHLTKDGSSLAACGWSGLGIDVTTHEDEVNCKKCIKKLNNYKTKEIQMRLKKYC